MSIQAYFDYFRGKPNREYKMEKSELEKLPNEILWELLSFLEGKDIANANILNKNFHSIVNKVIIRFVN